VRAAKIVLFHLARVRVFEMEAFMSRSIVHRAGLVGMAWGIVLVVPAFGVPSTPLADPSGFEKTRFISFSVLAPPVGESAVTALRVRFVTLHHVVPPYTAGPSIPFTAFEGQSVFVGAPQIFSESSSGGATFQAAFSQCAPHYQDWSTVGLLHVTGVHIVSSSLYEVEQLALECQGQEDACAALSTALEIRTTRWTDASEPFSPPSQAVQPDISDCSSLVNKFRNASGAPIKARAQFLGAPGNPWGLMNANVLGVDIGFSQVSASVDGFRCLPYPYKMGKCAGQPQPLNSGACTSDAECGGANGAGPCNLYCSEED